jgi:hypothetical protein
MTEIEQATKALIAAIDAARHRLPRGVSAYEAERDLLALCEKAERLIHVQCRRIKRRRSSRSSWRPWRPEVVLSKEQREQAQQVINVGYRALAAKLHPDAGGSPEAMTRLNQVRDRLKEDLKRRLGR